MKRYFILSMLLTISMLALSQLTEAQTPVDNLTNQHLEFIENQGDKLQFLIDRLRYRRESGYYFGNHNDDFERNYRYPQHFNYNNRSAYQNYQSGYSYNSGNYNYFGNYQNSRGRQTYRYRDNRWLETLVHNSFRTFTQSRYKSQNRQASSMATPTTLNCFCNSTSYYVDVYQIGGQKVARLAPGEFWPIPNSSSNYHTSVTLGDGTWFVATLKVGNCTR